MKYKKLIIAIDGHSSCGKSTLAKDLAKHFKYNYIDTGAMYRAVTLYVIENNFSKDKKINELLLQQAFEEKKILIGFHFNIKTKKSETLLNGKNIENQIRGIEVSNLVSPVAVIPFVRYRLVDLQREMGKGGGIVMDGRDIGTNVFPNADLKIFLTADAEIRAERRHKELKEKGQEVSFEDILKNVKERDHIDSTRKTNPLKQAKDAVLLDNSNVTVAEQTKIAINLINKVLQNSKK
ncbi:MAG: (d)CMP kinase [Bacteroidales bacterium]|nr:(d)CMP kinase [Bacteroidales bacterium]